MQRALLYPLILLAATLWAGCAINPQTGTPNILLVSEETELAIGQAEHGKILQKTKAYSTEALQAYVNQVGQKLAAQSERPGLEWHFTVLDSPAISAFNQPGGYVYVTRGLLTYLNNEAELAAILGHQISHISARHAFKNLALRQTAGLGLDVTKGVTYTGVAGMAESGGCWQCFLGGGLIAGAGATTGLVFAAPLTMYENSIEKDTDQITSDLLTRCDYPPTALHNIQTIVATLKHKGVIPKDQRFCTPELQFLQGVLISRQQHTANTPFLPATGAANPYLTILDKTPWGDASARLLLRAGRLYDLDRQLTFELPRHWTAAPDETQPNKATAKTHTAPNKPPALHITRKGSTNPITIISIGNKSAAQEIAHALFPNTKAADIKHQLTPVALDGLQATRFSSTLPASSLRSEQRQEGILLSLSANTNFLLYHAPGQSTEEEQAITTIKNSLRAISTADHAALQPLFIQTRAFPAGGWSELAQTSLLPYPEEDLRLLNGSYLGYQPSVGQMVKVVEPLPPEPQAATSLK